MKIAYFDCFAGASGNMILGSLLDAGLSRERVERELRRLPVTGWRLDTQRVNKRGLTAHYLDVRVAGENDHVVAPRPTGEHHHHEGVAHRTLDDVLSILRSARFETPVERAAESIFRNLAAAEAKVHGTSIDRVVFHEVGQVDAILDIAGAALGLHLLRIDRVFCSAFPCGKGRISSAHGESPSPAPATMELLRGLPTYFVDLDAEFVTPTGAAVLSTLASFEPRPPMTVDSIGYGAGRSEFPFPNVLRVIIGETPKGSAGSQDGDVVQIETNIDDMNPQLFEHVVERVFAAGALDVWTQTVGMKKGRPGIVVCALAPPERESAVAATLLAETTSIGVRSWTVRREILPRRSETVATSLGAVRVKVVQAPNGVRVRPEFEDCREIAQREGLALTTVMERIECEIAERRERERLV
jgi:pyridinium-3,5-bisthiocarboxylic acid mononucleotide nickel chelatase